MKKLDQLIQKYSYMFTEIERGQEVLRKHHLLMDEYTKAKSINDEIKIEQIKEEQKEVGSYYAITFGFECDDGWYDLIDETLGKIQEIDTEKKVTIHQIKEKFGGLIIHVGFTTQEIHDIIYAAERKSYKTCEVCGQNGKLCVANKWYKTVCKKHREIETWIGLKQIYKPARFFGDECQVFDSFGKVTKVVSGKFLEDLDTWQYILENGEIRLQENLQRVPYGYIDRSID